MKYLKSKDFQNKKKDIFIDFFLKKSSYGIVEYIKTKYQGLLLKSKRSFVSFMFC